MLQLCKALDSRALPPDLQVKCKPSLGSAFALAGGAAAPDCFVESLKHQGLRRVRLFGLEHSPQACLSTYLYPRHLLITGWGGVRPVVLRGHGLQSFPTLLNQAQGARIRM
ncbi:hypothetical protein MHYP_G00118890 [Metynnis hypsauchen]